MKYIKYKCAASDLLEAKYGKKLSKRLLARYVFGGRGLAEELKLKEKRYNRGWRDTSLIG